MKAASDALAAAATESGMDVVQVPLVVRNGEELELALGGRMASIFFTVPGEPLLPGSVGSAAKEADEGLGAYERKREFHESLLKVVEYPWRLKGAHESNPMLAVFNGPAPKIQPLFGADPIVSAREFYKTAKALARWAYRLEYVV